ncbi:citrate synthase [Sphingomonas sp. PAMC26645]|uniref:citrate synthase n=1 Tax=Sphingomonas sp. PAMC26645 TaxID=2565555 RepID=UPI001446B029|nr:citrate synthase [Sphingomonas sp. PAMC26645]
MEKGHRAESEYVRAEEAAAILGVSVTTLYVYVGRKGLRTRGVPGSRVREYLKADLEREVLRKATPRASSVDATLDSIVTQITAQGPMYRGRSAIELSEGATVEETAAILWNVPVGQAFTEQMPKGSAAFDKLAPLLNDYNGLDRATALLHTLEEADSRSFDLSPAGMARTGADIMRWLSAILFGSLTPGVAPIHEIVAGALALDERRAEIVRRLLVLAADHGLEPGARAVRAVASTGVTPWRTVTAGLLVAAGRQSWFGYAAAVGRLVDEILDSADVRLPLVTRLRQGERVPGFGSALYGGRDPRGRALLAACVSILPADHDIDKLQSALEMMREWNGGEPDFPFARAFVMRKLGSDRSDPLYPLARSAGWIAHSIEQYAIEDRMRPGRDQSLALRDDASHHVI